jgi:tRNA G46 methylase TrmB
MSDHPQDVHPAFFGRRKGHKLRPHHSALMDELLPRIALSTQAPCDIAKLFAFSPDALRLEIGFGGGEHLVAEAQAFPQTGFIGCEPYINGMAKALALDGRLRIFLARRISPGLRSAPATGASHGPATP